MVFGLGGIGCESSLDYSLSRELCFKFIIHIVVDYENLMSSIGITVKALFNPLEFLL